MDVIQSITSSTVAKPFLWSRSEIASRLQAAQAFAMMGASQQKCANEVDVPRTTLQNWLRNQQRLRQDGRLTAAEVQFFRVTPRARVPTSVVDGHPS